MDILIVFNPLAAHMRQTRLDELAGAYRAAGHNVHLIDSHDATLADAVRVADIICIAGGDGTVRDIASRIGDFPAGARVAVYPMGTINLIAREAGYVARCAEFVARSLSQDTPRHYHMAHMNNGAIMVCASVGPDSAAVAGVSSNMKRRFHRFAYAISALRMMYRWPRHRIEAVIDGENHICEAAYLLKGKYYAGPWILDNRADLRSDKMQALLLPKARRRDYVRLILATVVHPVFADSRWKRLSGSTFHLSSSAALPVQADGDITAMLPVDISVRRTAIAFG